MIQSPEDKLLAVYIANLDIIGEGFPININAKRREYIESFNLEGLPTNKSENYRHTPVKELFERDWENYFIPVEASLEELCTDNCEYSIKIHDGFVIESDKWKVLDNGVAIGSIKSALEHLPELVATHLNSMANNTTESLTALNSAFMQDSVFVWIPNGVNVEQPICIEYDFSTKDQQVMCFTRALIIAEDDTDAKISIRLKNSEGSFMINYVKELYVGKRSKVELTEFSNMGCDSLLFNNSYSNQKEHSQLKGINIWLGGELTRFNGVGNFDAQNCQNKFYGLYTSTKGQVFDINTYINHAVSDCHSFQQIKGIAGGSSTGAFTGRVYVAPDAQRSEAIQQCKKLLMSDEARVYTDPQLEIYADDVKCSHGATIGQINNESIYYMRQRGLDESDARKLLMLGYIDDIIKHCSIEFVSNEIVSSVDSIIEGY